MLLLQKSSLSFSYQTGIDIPFDLNINIPKNINTLMLWKEITPLNYGYFRVVVLKFGRIYHHLFIVKGRFT